MIGGSSYVVEKRIQDIFVERFEEELLNCAKRAKCTVRSMLFGAELKGLYKDLENIRSGTNITQQTWDDFGRYIFNKFSDPVDYNKLEALFDEYYLPIVRSIDRRKEFLWGPREQSRKALRDRFDRIRSAAGYTPNQLKNIECFSGQILRNVGSLARGNMFGKAIGDVQAILQEIDIRWKEPVDGTGDIIRMARNDIANVGIAAGVLGRDRLNIKTIYEGMLARNIRGGNKASRVRFNGQLFIGRAGYYSLENDLQDFHFSSLRNDGLRSMPQRRGRQEFFNQNGIGSAVTVAMSSVSDLTEDIKNEIFQQLIEDEEEKIRNGDFLSSLRLHTLCLTYIDSYIFKGNFHYESGEKDKFVVGEEWLLYCYDSMMELKETSHNTWLQWYSLAGDFMLGLDNTVGYAAALMRQEELYRELYDYSGERDAAEIRSKLGNLDLGPFTELKSVEELIGESPNLRSWPLDAIEYKRQDLHYPTPTRLVSACLSSPPSIRWSRRFKEVND